jgi:parvulin-like peptidyl-prolyl isomerase
LAEFGEKASPEEVGKAQSKADNVYSQLLAGKDFGTLAMQYSDDAYRVKGGDLGWVHRGRLDPEFEKVAFSLKPGETSKPFRTTYGFSILKVEAYEAARQMSFAEVSAQLQQELVQKNTLQLRHAWIAGLKKSAKIEILDKGINPSAAADLKGTAG